MSEKEEKELTLELKKLKLKCLKKLYEKLNPPRICYFCRSKKATILAQNVVLHGVFYICAVCHYFLIEKEDTEGFLKHLEKQDIEIYRVYPADSKPYLRFRKKGEKATFD